MSLGEIATQGPFLYKNNSIVLIVLFLYANKSIVLIVLFAKRSLH